MCSIVDTYRPLSCGKVDILLALLYQLYLMRITFLFLFIGVQLSGQNLFDDLVLYYSFDNGQAIDGSGNGLDGTLLGPVAGSDRKGAANQALSFVSGETIEISNSPSLQIQYPISFATWVKFDTNDFEDWSIIRVDFQKDNYSGWYVNRFGNGRFGFAAGGNLGGAGSFNSRSLFSLEEFQITNAWTHFALVVEGPSQGKMYVNGCEIPVSAGGSGVSDIVYTDNPTFIGRNDNNGSLADPVEPDRFFDGSLDEMYIWNRLITEEEIQFLYDDFYTPDISIADQSNCDDLTLSVSDSLANVRWSNGDQGTTATFTASGVYSVIAEYDCFEVTDTFELSSDPPSVVIDSTVDVCAGLAALSFEGLFDIVEWSTGETSPSIIVDENGDYGVTVVNSCGNAIDEVSILSLGDGSPSISGTSSYVFVGADTTVQASILTDADVISWSPTQGLSCTNCPDPIIRADSTITYTVTASNENGCETVYQVDLLQQRSLRPDLTIANVFHPSSLNPFNRRFFFPVDYVGTYDMQIYDRWGNVLYNATALAAGDPNQGWDGQWRGSPAAAGVYVYRIDLHFDEEVLQYTGTVTLLR